MKLKDLIDIDLLVQDDVSLKQAESEFVENFAFGFEIIKCPFYVINESE